MIEKKEYMEFICEKWMKYVKDSQECLENINGEMDIMNRN